MTATPRDRVAGAFDRLSTSYKLLILLSLSLLPIMLIALFASVQASRSAVDQHRQEYTALATDDAKNLDGVIDVDLRLLRNAIAALDRGASIDNICTQLRQVTGYRKVVRPFALYAAATTPICTSPGYSAPPRFTSLLEPAPSAVAITDQGALITAASATGSITGTIVYDRAALSELNRTVLRAPGVYDLTLTKGNREVSVVGPHARPLSSSVVSAPMRDSITLRLTISSPGASASDWLLALLPVLMWIAAAAVSFLVVDRALLRPLEYLRSAIATDRIDNIAEVHTPAHEIRDLANTLAGFASDRATHDASMGVALDRQTAATREVHHRVKNNLQVIASLISLHARATQDRGALEAFAAIQRRVDALAIVHRNHYAQSDQQGALDLKPVLNELTANLLTNLAGAQISAQVAMVRVSLDTATALTFLLTEFVELSILVDLRSPIALTVTVNNALGRLTVESRALMTGEAFDGHVAHRYGRIMNGLVRQLRTTLHHDQLRGCYAVEFPTLTPV